MTITEALQISNGAPPDGRSFEAALVCGFSPLHLQTLLSGHLQQCLPGYRVSMKTGIYGNVAATLETTDFSSAAAIAVVIEWSDLDPRLGFREAGAWGPDSVKDILNSVNRMLGRLADALKKVPAGPALAISLPTLPLPPLFHTPDWLASSSQTELELSVLEFGHRLGDRCALVNRQRLDLISPPAQRLDLRSDLAFGFPYSVRHADEIADFLSRLLARPAPKKGLITDLDDTLWSGIVGEVGPENVSWDLANHHQMHGLYQKLLASFAEEGTLIGIASKNDPETVDRVLDREDMILKRRHVFPVEVHWNAKSGSVARILQAWNISADSVVFVDDSRLELAEVSAAYPEIECVLFPADSVTGVAELLARLRNLFGKTKLSSEDSQRIDSLRNQPVFPSEPGAGTSESFLRDIAAKVQFDFESAGDARPLELVNKTNQFNLNGIRYTQAEWYRANEGLGRFLCVVSYQDKFGPLGKIAVIRGVADHGNVVIEDWVMSCRAFARRIEHQCLKLLFDRYRADELSFRFTATARNGPVQTFFEGFLGHKPEGAFTLERAVFEQQCPPLHHEIMTETAADAND